MGTRGGWPAPRSFQYVNVFVSIVFVLGHEWTRPTSTKTIANRCAAKIETDNTSCHKLATLQLIKDIIYDFIQNFIASCSNYYIR